MTLRIHPTDPDVQRRVRLAWLESMQPGKRDVTKFYRCRACRKGNNLASVTPTSFGPFFASGWNEPIIEEMDDGNTTTRRQVAKSFAGLVQYDMIDTGRGVAALLDLPSDLVQDFPDLLLRCEHHGDLVLDRGQIMREFQTDRRRSFNVDPKFPRLDYEPVDLEWVTDVDPITG